MDITNSMKKLLLFFAAMCCMMVANAYDFTVNGINYNVTSEDEEDKTVEVAENESSGSIVIPATVTYNEVTYRVTGIGEYAFCECEDLKSVTLPEGMESIGYGAFKYCGLKSITVLAWVPPTLGSSYVFDGVDKSIPVYVPDVDAYSNVSWGRFTNFQAINIDDYKQAAIAEIDAAMTGVTLSEDEEAAINGYINTITGVTTMSDANLATIQNAKNAALAVISQAAIRPARKAALAAIGAAMQGETSDYLTGLVQEYIDIINSTTDKTTINNAKNTALVALNAAVAAYKAIKAEALGSLGEKQDGPAVEVIDQDDNSVILYNPKKVNFIKVETEE